MKTLSRGARRPRSLVESFLRWHQPLMGFVFQVAEL